MYTLNKTRHQERFSLQLKSTATEIFIKNLQELHRKCGKITNLQSHSTTSPLQNFLTLTGNYCKVTFSKTEDLQNSTLLPPTDYDVD
jgi:hypothetical protein